ncbi:DNA-3-methyladenine glycosylase [Lingula anatina]|uniref:DNA-3-methyladenine glycosylase n=1 Tax=Lingula anatina TaxID=7574 RepID=A0A1S3KCH6_LINAN|nr:DNA-3-methyladenine glycosylase [Lingula anatina]|eukprot:XP_013420197.1 DNA-3-methyladenine glycosylase [Lingula anatina]
MDQKTTSKRKASNKKPSKNKDEVASKYFRESHESRSEKPLNNPTMASGTKHLRAFFELPCLELSKALLGQVLVRKLPNGERLSGRIVETEAYLGSADSASHSYKGPTGRNGAMFMQPGTAYVYNIYGMYCCMNISSQGTGSCVLLRALEPLENQDIMRGARSTRRQDEGKGLKIKDLCNGPSKLCQALHIDKDSINTQDLVTSGCIWLEKGAPVQEEEIIVSTRIGIESAGPESASKPYRFYVRNSDCVSRRDKKAEAKNDQS